MRITVALLGAFLVNGVAVAADFKPLPAKDSRVLVVITGEIKPGDADTFKSIIKSTNDAGKVVANVRLNSEGGNLVEGVKLADAIRYGKIATNVGKDATCASACFLVFAAGTTKFANYTAQIGVHGASTKDGEEASDGTVAMARVAKELGVPAAIIGRMVVTAPSDMVWLTAQDLQSMGTTMVGKPNQLTAPPSAQLPQRPTQTRPGEPMNLERPNSVAKNNAMPTLDDWNVLVESAFKKSAKQNNGRARSIRNCQPEMKVCSTGVIFQDEDGNDVMLIRREDINGKSVSNEICSFNKFGDTRSCLDFRSKAAWREMKNSNGQWIKVTDN